MDPLPQAKMLVSPPSPNCQISLLKSLVFMQFLAAFGYKRFSKIYFADLYPPYPKFKGEPCS